MTKSTAKTSRRFVANSEKTMREAGIAKPLQLDIVLGRGGMANNHVGNKLYREVVDVYKVEYLNTTESRKAKDAVVRKVLLHLKEEGYRFVQKLNDLWSEAPVIKARAKVVQALREGAPELRKEIEAHGSPSASPITTVRSLSGMTEYNVTQVEMSNAMLSMGVDEAASVVSQDDSLEQDATFSEDLVFDLQPLPYPAGDPLLNVIDLDESFADILWQVVLEMEE